MLYRGLRSLNSHGLQRKSAKSIRNYVIDAIEKVVGKETVDRLVNSIDDIKSIVRLFIVLLYIVIHLNHPNFLFTSMSFLQNAPISSAINLNSSEKWQWNYGLDS